MEEKIVKTINGVEAYEKNCRLIDGKYYLIGNNKIENSGDVYLINNRYIRSTTKMVVFDHFEKEYKYRNNALTEGIIGTDGETLIKGFFSRHPLYNVKVVLKDKTEDVAISSNVLNFAYRERLSSGVFYHISLLEASRFNDLRGVPREVKEALNYDAKSSIDRVMKTYETNYNPVICRDAQNVGESLKHYTFGLEFETSIGIIPNNKLSFLPLIPLRDGSIDGLEFATVPLQGPKGVQAIIDCADELNRRTEFNDGCSLHFHIGGMPRTVEFILAFYKFMSVFQDEIFSMFPIYKKQNFGVKRKNYSAPFPFEEVNFRMEPAININDRKQVNKNFDILFQYLSGGNSFEEYGNELRNVQSHPADPNGNQKWNIKHRYSFINFIPLIFGNKQTIEFRIHTPTYNSNKIIDFLMLNTYLIDYVSLNIKGILAGTDYFLRHNRLSHFLDTYVPKYINAGQRDIYSEITHYVTERRHRAESLTREYGVNFKEEFIRPSKYLRLKPYKYTSKIADPYDVGLNHIEEMFFNPFGESPSQMYERMRDSERKMAESAARSVLKKSSKSKSVRRSSIVPDRNIGHVMREGYIQDSEIKDNTEKVTPSSIGSGYFSWDMAASTNFIGGTDPTPYIRASEEVKVKMTDDEGNIF